jgi:hypothetical protein
MALSFSLSNAVSYTDAQIDANVTKKRSGVYVLGPKADGGGVGVKYVGRSDDDLAGRLKNHELKSKHSHFVFAYASNADDAFKKECELYHEWPQSLSSQIHPARPKNSNVQCPKGCKT